MFSRDAFAASASVGEPVTGSWRYTQPMPLDPSTDYRRFTFPTPRAITMVSVRPSNLPNVTTAVSWSQRGKVSYRQQQLTNGALVRPECSYLLSRHADTNGNGPWKPGDTLTDAAEVDPTGSGGAGVTYTVQTVESDDYYHFLSCFNPKIAFNLRDLVNIPVATDVLSTTATRTTTFANEATSVICRRQPTSTELKTMYGHQADSRMFDIFFAVNYAFQPRKHTISWTEGSDTIVADIVRVDQSDRIDVCQRVMVEVRP